MDSKSDALPSTATSRTLVVYQFFEKDQTYVDNFLHFLVHGYDEANDHVVVIAGDCTIELPRLPKLKYLFTENKNNDYGGYSDLVSSWPTVFDYDVVFFVNSSVRGPFLLPGETRHWTSFFTDRLLPGVGLVGTSINIMSALGPVSPRYQAKYGGQPPYTHVQTMAYCLPHRSLRHLHDIGFYQPRPALAKHEVIEDYEIRLTQLILANGWNVACLMPEYDTIDFRAPHAEINLTSIGGDPNFPNAYFGRTAHPFEVLFVKTNRDIFPVAYLERLAHSASYGHDVPADVRAQPLVRAWLDKVAAVRNSRDAAPLVEQRLMPDEILNFTRVLLALHPQYRGDVEAILAQAPKAPAAPAAT